MTSENNNENDILNEQESLTVDIGQHLKNARENIGIDINEIVLSYYSILLKLV